MAKLIFLTLVLTTYLGIGSIRASSSGAISTKKSSSKGQENEDYLGNRAKSLFDWEGSEALITKIKSIRGQENQRMVFLLENNQIWIQIEPRQQPFKEDELVSIKASYMGGFKMESRSGLSTMVRRIQ